MTVSSVGDGDFAFGPVSPQGGHAIDSAGEPRSPSLLAS